MSLPPFFHLIVFLFICMQFFGTPVQSDINSKTSCGALRCTTSTGINILYASSSNNNVDTAYISTVDSMWINLSVSQCSAGLDTVKLNGMPVPYVARYNGYAGTVQIRLLSNPGNYRVTGTVQGQRQTLYFTLILNSVGIKELSNNEAFVKIYPNPAREFISVRSEKEVLKKVSLKNSLGQEVKSFDVNSDHLEIPLDDLPSGIYFVQVVTLSDKINISKIIIE